MSKYWKIIIFLLVPLIINSCSVDWSNKRDSEVDSLKKQVQELKKQNEQQKEQVFVCPENISNPQEQTDAVAKFISDYSKKNPDATIADLHSHRFDVLVENKCTKTLWHMLESVSPDDFKVYFNGKVFWPQNAQFTPDTRVWTAYYTIDGQWLENPDEELIFNFYLKNVWTYKTFTAKTIADSIVNSYNGNTNAKVMGSFMTHDKITWLDDYIIISKTIYNWYGYVYM